MKFILILFSIVISNTSFSQNCSSKKYAQILKYIAKVEQINQNTIYLSDTIVYLEYVNFQDLKVGNSISNIEKISKLDETQYFKPFYSNEITPLNQNKRSEYILFTSKQFDNTIIVELFKNNTSFNKKYSNYTMFGDSKQYLLKINKRLKITHSKKIEMNYN